MLAIHVTLPHGRYEAGAGGRWGHTDGAEWPPHPARLHCALRAGATSDEHGSLLRWLEHQHPPEVWAAATPLGQTVHPSYVVTGTITGKGGSQFHVGRTNQLRQRASVTPGMPTFAFVWPELSPNADRLRLLRDLTARVPYLGRSTSTAIIAVHSGPFELQDGWEAFVPAEGRDNELDLRVAYPGYTDALEDNYAQGSSAWEAARDHGYRLRASKRATHGVGDQHPGSGAAVCAEHTEMVTFGFPAGVTIDGLHSGMVAARLRSAVIARTPDPVPAEVSGHGADGRPHVAYLPLLDIGHRHAQGHLLGVAVALPALRPPARTAVLTGLLGQGPFRLKITDDIHATLQPEGQRQDRHSDRLRESWWRRPARSWVSVTPMVLDRFCGVDNVEEEIARACGTVGLPIPEEIVPSAGPLVAGGAALRRRHLARREQRPRPISHALVRFPVPVRGPVLLGAQRFLGMGLFAPLPEQEAQRWAS